MGRVNWKTTWTPGLWKGLHRDQKSGKPKANNPHARFFVSVAVDPAALEERVLPKMSPKSGILGLGFLAYGLGSPKSPLA